MLPVMGVLGSCGEVSVQAGRQQAGMSAPEWIVMLTVRAGRGDFQSRAYTLYGD